MAFPFGINCVPEDIQKLVDDIFSNVEEVNHYFNDITLGSAII